MIGSLGGGGAKYYRLGSRCQAIELADQQQEMVRMRSRVNVGDMVTVHKK